MQPQPVPYPRRGPAQRPRRAGPKSEPALVSMLDRFGGQLAEELADCAGPEVEEVTYRLRRRRMPHDMAGSMGYSLTSNWFMAQVLARCIVAHRLSPLQAAVLLHIMGSQSESMFVQKQSALADELGVARTSVNSAIRRLCELNYIRRGPSRGTYQVNPRLCFQGNGDVQNRVLAGIRAEQLASQFPDTVGPQDFIRER